MTGWHWARRLRRIWTTAGNCRMSAMRHAYLGPAFDEAAIETALKTYKLRYTRSE